jgi:DoxX-like family
MVFRNVLVSVPADAPITPVLARVDATDALGHRDPAPVSHPPMSTAYIVIAAAAALANLAAATFDLLRPGWLLANMTRLGVPHSQLMPLGVLKVAGAAGLLAGIAVPVIGIAAAVGLVVFFLGAIATAARAHWYGHIPQPAAYLALAAAALVLGLASL